MPPATVESFRAHGQVAATLAQHLEGSAATLAQIKSIGINLDAAMQELQDEGVASFVKSFENLTAALVKSIKRLTQLIVGGR